MIEDLFQILKGCKKNQRKFQEKLFKIYYGKIKSVCMRYSRDINQTEDYLQDVFIKIFTNIHKFNFQNESSFEAWMKTTTRNTIIDSIRKEKKIQSKENDYQLDVKTLESFDDDNSFDFLETSHKLTEVQIMEEIQKLPLAQRTVFNMFVIDELGHKEISETLGIQEGTSKSNLHKAKIKLKEELKKYINV